MVDLHCHILPFLDDGPSSVQEAAEMARLAAADGITDILATPHTGNGLYENRRDEIEAAVRSLQDVLDHEQIKIAIHPGSEVHIHLELLHALRDDQIAMMCANRRYLLLELPVISLPLYTEQMLTDLLSAGITPIIAHVERNVALQKNSDALRSWMSQGVLTQVNGCSLLGRSGKQTRAFAEYLLQNGCVQVLASDAHNTKTRPPILSEAYRLTSQLISEGAAEVLEANARAVLRGDECIQMEPFTGYRKRKMRWF